MRKEGKSGMPKYSLVYIILAVAVVYVLGTFSYQVGTTGFGAFDPDIPEVESAEIPETSDEGITPTEKKESTEEKTVPTVSEKEVEGITEQIDKEKTKLPLIKEVMIKIIEKKSLDSEELGSSEITISKGEVIIDDIVIPTSRTELHLQINEKEVIIESTEKGIIITNDIYKVFANTLTVQDNILSIGGSIVKVAPEEVIANLRVTPNYMELNKYRGLAIYIIRTNTPVKILGFIPTEINNEYIINAETGETIKHTSPWWAGFASQKQ